MGSFMAFCLTIRDKTAYIFRWAFQTLILVFFQSHDRGSLILNLLIYTSRKMSANGPLMTDALTITVDLQAQGWRLGTISIIGMVAIVRNLEKRFFSTTTSDDKVSVKHSIKHVTGFCETRNNRATGVISGVVNPAGAPVQQE